MRGGVAGCGRSAFSRAEGEVQRGVVLLVRSNDYMLGATTISLDVTELQRKESGTTTVSGDNAF